VRSELEPRERVDGDGIGRDTANVAEELEHIVLGKYPTDAVAEPGQVLAGDRSVHGELDGLCHRLKDGAAGECSSTPMSFNDEDGLLLR
jgi:hypothetical protein